MWCIVFIAHMFIVHYRLRIVLAIENSVCERLKFSKIQYHVVQVYIG